jgi:hypothetical protein
MVSTSVPVTVVVGYLRLATQRRRSSPLRRRHRDVAAVSASWARTSAVIAS